MKKLLILISIVYLANNNVFAQNIYIPDVNFKNALIGVGVDKNGDGKIQESEALEMDSLTIGSKNISNLIGIESFKNLRYLDCSYNSLSNIDMSQLAQIKFLNFTYNKISNIDLSSNLQLETLICHFNSLTSLKLNHLANLKKLACSSNRMTELDLNNLTKLEDVQIDYNNITSIKLKNLPNLKILQCASNKMIGIDLSDLKGLEYFSCYFSSLQSLNINGLSKLESISSEGCKDLTSISLHNLPSLKDIYFKECNLKDISFSGLDKLESIDLRSNQITELDISHFKNLKEVVCDNNQISDFNIGYLDMIEFISCSNNKIEKFDFQELNSLKGINCSNNLLKEIDLNNVVNLEFLECNKNLLSNIDVSFLENLQILNCSGNQLTELDISQLIRLFELDCSKNQLKQIDISPLPQLTNFNCTYNPIEALYIKNGVYNMTSCPFSPPFPCYKYQVFDSVPNLKYICADAEEIDGFKTAAINNGYPDITINSLCSSTLGGTFSLIVGRVKLDIHNNGCNESDTAYPNLKVKISNDIDSTYIISGSDGNFSAYLNPGTYIFEPILNHLKYFDASPISSTLTLPDTVSPIFCITPKGDFNDLSVNIIPITAARPGFSDAQYKVVFKNQGTTTQSGTVTFNFDENKMNVIGSSPIADQSNNGQLGFDFSNLAPFESRSVIVTMRINSPADNTPVHVGDELEFSANINGQPDETPEDNTALLNQKVIGSFDPNDKTCLEGDIITPDKVGKRVNYLIRFENTGTAPAENVLITDYIDTTVFDINTLLMTDASHTCHTQISKGNKVQFIFSDIQLPYTEPDKHGFVAFSIQLKKYLQIGDSIKNHADIYFDYNLPVTTNEAVSEIKNKVITSVKQKISNIQLSVYPNPSKGNFSVELKSNTNAPVVINVIDIKGKIVFAKQYTAQQGLIPIQLEKLAKGTYLVQAQQENDIVSRKVVVQ